jgi:hypothetical protein
MSIQNELSNASSSSEDDEKKLVAAIHDLA